MTTTTAYVKDFLILKAAEIPENLVFDPNTEKGAFLMQFMLEASSEDLKKISAVCEQHKEKNIELWFNEKEIADKPAKLLSDYAKYEDYKNLRFEVKNTVGQFVKYAASPITHYIDVIFYRY